jgi:excinuclease ABC subunit C
VRDDPANAVRAVVGRLPLGPGVYRFRDARGRALYLGRAVSLRRRVASYWSDLGDRPHLSAMVRAIARIEAVECASEHEAAWLERSLLEHRLLPWNRTAGGQEVEVYLRLDSAARSSGLTVVHDAAGRGAAARYFGPYLGGLRVRLAAAALLRAYPLDYAGDSAGTARELGRRRGADPADRLALAAAIGAVLVRDPAAIAAARAELIARRAAAAADEAYEVAARIQIELTALDWVTAPQRVVVLEPAGADAVACGWADGVLVRFAIRGGRVRGWSQGRASAVAAAPLLAQTPPPWRDFAEQSARLAARLSAAAHDAEDTSSTAGATDGVDQRR